MNRVRRLAAAIVSLGILAPAAAAAQGIDLSHGGPIAITARDGIEWLQQQHEVIATGNARAVRQNVTVDADRLIAFYRKKAGTGSKSQATANQPQANGEHAEHPAAAGPADVTGVDNGDNEIYRLEAIGHVVITTPTDRAQGDKAVYDLDRAVLVLTGNNLRLATPSDVLTARDDVEYWSARHMAVARGDAVVITKDNRRLSADVLVGYTVPQDANAAKPTPASAPAHQTPGNDPLEASGKLQKVEAFGHVVVSTPTDVVTGDRGVYVPDTGIAVLMDNVRITRGQNELAGSEAEVNVKTGVSRLIAAPTGKVEGLLVPNEAQTASAPATHPGAPRR